MKNLIVTLLALIVIFAYAEAKCKYRRGAWSECDAMSIQTRTNTLKVNKRRNQDSNCPMTKVDTRPCKIKKPKKMKCKYNKRGVESECDPVTKTYTIVKTLISTDNPNCAPMKNITKPCKPPAGCVYDMKMGDLECTNSTAVITGSIMKDKNNGTCPQTFSKSFRVRDCDSFSRKFQSKKEKRAKKLQKKNQDKQAKKERKDRKRANKKNKRKNRKGAVCKYSRAEWADCDETTDTMSKTTTLLSGPDVCEPSLTVYKKCRKSCKYTKGRWGECDPNTHIKERTDTLKVSVSKDFCESTRKVSKKCGRKGKKSDKGCKYKTGDWTACDPGTGLRSRTKTLVSGSPSKCKVEKTINKKCERQNGEERCFFGKWQDWEECRNGVQRKQRPVLQGGVECQRKGVRTRQCSSS